MVTPNKRSILRTLTAARLRRLGDALEISHRGLGRTDALVGALASFLPYGLTDREA